MCRRQAQCQPPEEEGEEEGEEEEEDELLQRHRSAEAKQQIPKEITMARAGQWEATRDMDMRGEVMMLEQQQANPTLREPRQWTIHLAWQRAMSVENTFKAMMSKQDQTLSVVHETQASLDEAREGEVA